VSKKRTLLVLVLAAVVATSGFSIGIGGAFGLQPVGGLPGSDVMLSAKFDELPFLMGLGFAIGNDVFAMGFTADWWMYHQNLVNFINLYAGPGLFVGVGGEAFQLGARVPIGLNIWPIDVLELFLEIAPTISAVFADPIRFPEFALQAAFGFRFWF
jgi:hypothetical protein